MARYNPDTGEYDEDDDFDALGERQPGGGDGGRPDLDAIYRDILGRGMDEGERRSEYENYAKYGEDQLRQNLRERAGNDPGGEPRNDDQSSVSSAYHWYLGRPSEPSQQQNELTGFLKQLLSQQEADRARQAQERAALMEILTGRMKTAQEPVSTETPGIRELLAARRVQSQRGAERERAALAERLHAQGLGDSGKLETGILGLEQDRSERDAFATAEVLNRELTNKRAELQQLLALAAQLGDTQATRTLQSQLAALDAQIQQTSLAEGSRRFDEDLGFRQSSFLDDLGYRMLALQLGANQNAAGAFL